MWLTLITLGLRLFGLAEWFEQWRKQRAERKQTQAVANAPTTKEELDERLQDHKF